MQHRDDPSGTAPKTTLYETEPGLSVENSMAVSTCWHFSSQPFMAIHGTSVKRVVNGK